MESETKKALKELNERGTVLPTGNVHESVGTGHPAKVLTRVNGRVVTLRDYIKEIDDRIKRLEESHKL